jgi:hypothetical protein
MNTIQVLIRAATVALLIGIPQLTSSQKVTDSSDILNRPTGEVQLRNPTTPDILAQALINAGVPGGIAVRSYCGGFESRFLNRDNELLLLRSMVSRLEVREAEPNEALYQLLALPEVDKGLAEGVPAGLLPHCS